MVSVLINVKNNINTLGMSKHCSLLPFFVFTNVVLGVEVALGIRLHGACSSNSRTICCRFCE